MISYVESKMQHKWIYVQNRNRLTDIEKRLVVAKGEGVGEGMEWEVGVSRCKQLLLLSHFSRVRLCATPEMAAHQARPSLGFSRQEHWSGLPFPSPMRESEVAQLCQTLHDPMDCSLPGSSIHGIFQATVLEWGAIAFSIKHAKLSLFLLKVATQSFLLFPTSDLTCFTKNIKYIRYETPQTFSIYL